MQIDTKLDINSLLERLSLTLNKESQTWKPITYPTSKKQNIGITASERDEKIRWLVMLTKTNGFTPETLALSIYFFDNMVSSIKIQVKYLTCITFTCHYLAAKIIEENNIVPRIYELLDNSSCPNSVSEVIRMERAIVSHLKWNLSAITSLDFLCIFYALLVKHYPASSLTACGSSLKILSLSQLATRLSICQQRHQLLSYQPSVVALALLNSSLKLRGVDSEANLHLMIRMTELNISTVRECQTFIDTIFNFGPKKNLYCKSSKRKVSESQDDMYDGLKRLYNNDKSVHPQIMAAMSLCSTSVRLSETSVTGSSKPDTLSSVKT